MTRLLLLLLRAYQLTLSPLLTLLGAGCRFHPTCSRYAAEAIALHGPLGGTWRAMKRLGRCHPFHPGGLDEVDPPRALLAARGEGSRATRLGARSGRTVQTET
jgi:putative membrane protein insertion efficiency factor